MAPDSPLYAIDFRVNIDGKQTERKLLGKVNCTNLPQDKCEPTRCASKYSFYKYLYERMFGGFFFGIFANEI